MRKILTAIPKLGETLSRGGHRDAAKGILTTDTKPKEAAVVRDTYSVGGMAKGCGMLAPNMATMLAFLTTDAELSPDELKPILFRAADATFNELITDGATSTNDTVMLFASGRKGRPARHSGILTVTYSRTAPYGDSAMTAEARAARAAAFEVADAGAGSAERRRQGADGA